MALTVQEIVDRLTMPIGEIPNTVDLLKSGNPNMGVKGITTSFMPSQHVIDQSIRMGANLLITHEGLYYSHRDQTEIMKQDSVYQEKSLLINESGIAIFRFHDYWHRYQPDGIMAGLVDALGWALYVERHQPTATILTIPSMTVKVIAGHVKKQLGIEFVRTAGDVNLTCSRIGLLAGYRGGGALSIPLFEKEKLDLIIYGEGPEWETPEYVRDSVYQGKNKALIVLGHAESEESGMKYLAQQIKKIFPHIPVHFIPEKPVFQVI